MEVPSHETQMPTRRGLDTSMDKLGVCDRHIQLEDPRDEDSVLQILDRLSQNVLQRFGSCDLRASDYDGANRAAEVR